MNRIIIVIILISDLVIFTNDDSINKMERQSMCENVIIYNTRDSSEILMELQEKLFTNDTLVFKLSPYYPTAINNVAFKEEMDKLLNRLDADVITEEVGPFEYNLIKK